MARADDKATLKTTLETTARDILVPISIMVDGTSWRQAENTPTNSVEQVDPPIVHRTTVVALGFGAGTGEVLIEIRRTVTAAIVVELRVELVGHGVGVLVR